MAEWDSSIRFASASPRRRCLPAGLAGHSKTAGQSLVKVFERPAAVRPGLQFVVYRTNETAAKSPHHPHRDLINRDVRNDHAWMSACTPEAACKRKCLEVREGPHADESGRRRQVPPVHYDRAVSLFGELAGHPMNRPAIQPIKPKNGMGASGAKTRRPMPESESRKSGYRPNQSGMLSKA